MTHQHVEEDLRSFNAKYRPQLQALADLLQARGVCRLHYGVDYVNDDGDAAEYAVYEYADGRSIEQGAWPGELEYNVFVYGVRYCQPYTFDVSSATLLHDTQGGQIDTEENVIRAYHTPGRRLLLEEEAEGNEQAGDLVIFNATCGQELQELADELSAQGVQVLHFGIDALTRKGLVYYLLSDWCVVERDGQEEVLQCLPALTSRDDLWHDLPWFGAFSLDIRTAQVVEDLQGGSVEVHPNETRAFHTEAQRQALMEKSASRARSSRP
ncbi:hypothetical protein [Deinococcus hohokamensis]|uniref:Uncharacterized protein n=1 Tax=Deinococcus hohokamensis TaxID=309883 RepID=A0ABV9I6F2_9DEIO